MERKALTKKVIVLGVDGFDPKLAKKLLDRGEMPALKEFTVRGAARKDLVLLEQCQPLHRRYGPH